MKTFNPRNLLTAAIIANGVVSSVWAVPLEVRQPADLDLTSLVPNVLEARQDKLTSCIQTEIDKSAPSFKSVSMLIPSAKYVEDLFLAGGLLVHAGELSDFMRRITWMTLAISVMLDCGQFKP
jgi:hypothetical protein